MRNLILLNRNIVPVKKIDAVKLLNMYVEKAKHTFHRENGVSIFMILDLDRAIIKVVKTIISGIMSNVIL